MTDESIFDEIVRSLDTTNKNVRRPSVRTYTPGKKGICPVCPSGTTIDQCRNNFIEDEAV